MTKVPWASLPGRVEQLDIGVSLYLTGLSPSFNSAPPLSCDGGCLAIGLQYHEQLSAKDGLHQFTKVGAQRCNSERQADQMVLLAEDVRPVLLWVCGQGRYLLRLVVVR